MDPRLKFASDVTVKDGVITAILSTEAVDRDGDIVRQSGWQLDKISGTLPLMSCHKYDSLLMQIGEWQNLRIDPERKALIGNPVYYTDCGNPEADYAYQLALKGRATFSVGFAPEESQPIKSSRGFEFTKQELLEASHVPIPSNREAVQLAAKAFQRRWQTEQRQNGRIVRKWDSAFMDNDDDPMYGGYSPVEQRCIVPGCDDASQITTPICSEHLKVLINAKPEPAGSPPDDDTPLGRAFSVITNAARRTKAGRVVSTANMTKLHSAMQSLKDVHDAACTDDDCPLDEEPPAAADKSVKAMGEGGSSEGGAIVSDSGTHGAFTGTHSHQHAANGAQGGDAGHSHEHSHDGSGDHGHAHGKGAAVAEQTATKSFDLNAALDAVLAGVEW